MKKHDAVVIVIDQDKDRSRHDSARIAQESTVFDIRRAIGVAVQEYDAWFLADNSALSTVLNMLIHPQPDPERHNAPKQACSDLVEAAAVSISLTELYVRLASKLSVDAVIGRCPRGFEPFSARLREMCR